MEGKVRNQTTIDVTKEDPRLERKNPPLSSKKRKFAETEVDDGKYEQLVWKKNPFPVDGRIGLGVPCYLREPPVRRCCSIGGGFVGVWRVVVWHVFTSCVVAVATMALSRSELVCVIGSRIYGYYAAFLLTPVCCAGFGRSRVRCAQCLGWLVAWLVFCVTDV